jgi:hypothetical protein
MSSLEQAKESIKKKMQLMDYEAIPQGVNTPTPQEVKTPRQEKVKVTVYLTEEHWEMFNTLCLEEMKRSGKPEKSKILCDAIEHLYKLRSSS